MPPRPKKPSEKVSSRLLEVVRFLSMITKDEGAPQDTHILLANKTATAFNGTLGAGAIIEEDLNAAPHAKTFLNALIKCGESYSLTQLDAGRLSIKSGPFKAIIPCIDPTLLYFPTPDNNVGMIDNSIKDAISVIEKIKSENGQRVVTLSFLLNGKSLISTDGKILIEVWHGLDLPNGVPIPKTIIPVILNQDKKLTGFGIGNTTVTFYYEDNSFIRSQLYSEAWPDISNILNRNANPTDIPKDFFKALDTITPFADKGFILFNDGKLQSHDTNEKGAEFEVEGILKGPVYSVKYLNLLKDVAEKADFYVPAERKSLMCYFIGKNCRGVLMGYG